MAEVINYKYSTLQLISFWVVRFSLCTFTVIFSNISTFTYNWYYFSNLTVFVLEYRFSVALLLPQQPHMYENLLQVIWMCFMASSYRSKDHFHDVTIIYWHDVNFFKMLTLNYMWFKLLILLLSGYSVWFEMFMFAYANLII